MSNYKNVFYLMLERIIPKKPKKKINGFIDAELADEIKQEAKVRKVSIGHIIEHRLFQLKNVTSKKIKR